jgi:hypothetical protein
VNHVPDPKQVFALHLQDSELISHLDGELSHSDRQRVTSHLESCWDCRSRLNSLQSSIEKLIEFRKTFSNPSQYGTQEMRVEQFRSRLQRHAVETIAEVSWWRRIADTVSSALSAPVEWLTRYRQPALAVVVASCLLITMFTDVWTTRVSAETVLVRMQTYNSAHQPAEGSILRTSVRIEKIEPKRDRTYEVEKITVLRDSVGDQTVVESERAGVTNNVLITAASAADLLPRAVGSPELAVPVLQFLASVRWIPDLSSTEFRKILSGRGVQGDSAKKVGGLFELHFPFSAAHPSTITEAVYLVDARDYAPVRMSLLTTEAGNPVEYRFIRSDFRVEPRTAELARLFSSNETASRPPGTTARTSRVVPLTYLNSTASEAEVAVASVLHGSDACLGEELHIFPMSDGSLLIQGLMDSTVRRDAVRRALKSVSGPLTIEIYLARELKSGSQLLKPPDEPVGQEANEPRTAVVTTLADLSNQRIPMHDVLYRHFSNQTSTQEETERQVNAFSNEVVTLARQTFLHAWALKRLDREFSGKRTASLPAVAAQAIERMREDHRRWIATISHRQAQTLGSVVESGATSSLDASADSNADTDTLLRLAQEQNDLVRTLFTTSSRPIQPSASVTRLLALLKQMGA